MSGIRAMVINCSHLFIVCPYLVGLLYLYLLASLLTQSVLYLFGRGYNILLQGLPSVRYIGGDMMSYRGIQYLK
jgi:hypothetical protein